MRVLICSVSRNTGPTGVCRFTANLCQTVAEFADPILAVGNWQSDYFKNTLGCKSPIVSVELENNSWARNRWYLTGLRELCAAHQADILHLAFPIPLKRSKSRTKVVGTIHDLYPFDMPENFGFPAYLVNRGILRRFVSSVDLLSCVSSTTRNRLDSLFPKEAARLNPTVIPNEILSIAIPAGWPKSSTEPFFLVVAQHRKNKNILRVMAAFAKVRKRLANGVKLVIVGEPALETDAINIAVRTLELDTVVEFRHHISDMELLDLYRRTMGLLSPSLFEGFCLPTLEAGQYGCPILVSDLPIFHETTPFADCFVNPLDIDSISDGIAFLSQVSRHPNRSLNAYRRPSLISQYRDFYLSALS